MVEKEKKSKVKTSKKPSKKEAPKKVKKPSKNNTPMRKVELSGDVADAFPTRLKLAGEFQDFIVKTLQRALNKMHFMDVTREELVITLVEIFRGLEVVVDSVYTVEIQHDNVAPKLKKELRESLSELGINFDTGDPEKVELAEGHLLILFKKLYDANLTSEDYLMFGNIVGSYLYSLIEMFTSSDSEDDNEKPDGGLPVQ